MASVEMKEKENKRVEWKIDVATCKIILNFIYTGTKYLSLPLKIFL